MDDHELLQAYAASRDEDAFKSLTERYMGLVYSAALRQTGNQPAADDVTQAVFLTLAQKAGKISRKVVLAGWLLRTTRYAAANARRLEQRRQHYERGAMQAEQMSENDAAWHAIAPMLDEAVDGLPDKDRDALVLRFFEALPLRAVAERLGTSEDGAQKRVSRAVEKLREFFGRRGRAVSAGVLVTAMAANAVQAAPGIAVPTTSQAAEVIAQGTLRTLNRLRLHVLAVRTACVAVLLGLAIWPFAQPRSSSLVTPKSAQLSQVLPRTKPKPVSVAKALAQPDTTKELLMHVVDSQTGAPVGEARLTLVSSLTGSTRSTNVFVADANGTAAVKYSTNALKNWSHRVEVFRDGYVPKYVSWSEYQQDSIGEIPSEYAAKVEPAVMIGGRVVDEQDDPIAGARIVFSVSGPTQSLSRERPTMMGNYHAEMTDTEGRWTCTHVPARFGMITFRPTHPQFQDQSFMPDSPEMLSVSGPTRIPEADFLALRAVMRLQPGLIVAGIVTDENDQPMIGARVTENYSYSDPEQFIITHSDGRFRFENGGGKGVSLTLRSPGYASVVTSIVMNASADELRIMLLPGKKLTGRIVNENGEAIPDATVEPAIHLNGFKYIFLWRGKSDAEGRFSWDLAPSVDDYAVSASGYETQNRVTLNADAGEQVVRLKKKPITASVRILGQIMDIDTREPLAESTIQIWETSRDLSSFTTHPENVAPNGKFRLKTSSGTVSYVLEANAKGYWPKRITNSVNADSETWIDFALAKAAPIGGVVFTPNGQPAAGATLAVRGQSEWVQMKAPGQLQFGGYTTATGATADERGAFQLSPAYNADFVDIAHGEGFIEIPFSRFTSNTLIRLQPCGRIEGRALLGGKPLVNKRIFASGIMDRAPRVGLSYNPKTDENGHFVFETVPPGEWRVQREISEPPSTGKVGLRVVYYTHAAFTSVRAGETATVVLGGSGQAVSGKALASLVDADVWRENCILLTRSEEPGEYRGMFAADGAFRIEDVPPGDYTLKINLLKPWNPADGNTPKLKQLASFERTVSVPTDSDLDLGTLELVVSP